MDEPIEKAQIKIEYEEIKNILNERSVRWWCASKAMTYNRLYSRGGVSIVSCATGVSRTRIYRGMKEIELGTTSKEKSQRKAGGGRKKN